MADVISVRLRRYGLLFGVCLVCLLLLTAQTRGFGPGRGAADAVAFVVTPVQSLLAKIHRGALGLWTTYVDWKSVRSENSALRLEAERLQFEALQVEEIRQENARLRRLLALRERLPLSAVAGAVAGEVVGREEDGWVRALTVNCGRRSRPNRRYG
jgi:rod shape-determining protein MreC